MEETVGLFGDSCVQDVITLFQANGLSTRYQSLAENSEGSELSRKAKRRYRHDRPFCKYVPEIRETKDCFASDGGSCAIRS